LTSSFIDQKAIDKLINLLTDLQLIVWFSIYLGIRM